MQSTTPAWLTLAVAGLAPLAALAGVFGSLRIETKRQRATQERDRELRAEERALRSADYQRQTLHELQEALVDLLETSFVLARPDRRSTETRHKRFLASARLTMLTQRVADEAVRNAVDEAAAAFEVVILDEPPHNYVSDAMEAQNRAQGAIGVNLRSMS